LAAHDDQIGTHLLKKRLDLGRVGGYHDTISPMFEDNLEDIQKLFTMVGDHYKFQNGFSLKALNGSKPEKKQ
jgi:hypothetical protein